MAHCDGPGTRSPLLNYRIVDQIARHYGHGEVLRSILDALRAEGKELANLSPEDLAPFDAFHIRGREATIELAAAAGFCPGESLLDLGCGLGGACRFLAREYGMRATGIDLTDEFVQAANALSELVGARDVECVQGSVTSLPFSDGRFDAVWTEHVQMNVADKPAMASEAFRVLRPGGRMAFHDVFAGTGETRFPVPWANEPSLSHLVTADEARALYERSGFRVMLWRDCTAASIAWFDRQFARAQEAGARRFGLPVVMGEGANEKLRNVALNLAEGRIVTVQAVLVRD